MQETITNPILVSAGKIEPSAFFKFSYGLFVLSSKQGGRHGGCIVNTGIQLTDNPKRILVAVNKSNFTCELIAESGVLNLSFLTEDAPFALFQHYGFQSGRTVDKLAYGAIGAPEDAPNGVKYLTEYTNALISGKVIQAQDHGTHTLFVAEVSEAVVLGSAKSMTYEYYFGNVKPKPQAAAPGKKTWVCKICGYVHEGETLPPDFICPLCKHGADAFEESPPTRPNINNTNNNLGGLSMKKYVCSICGYVHEGNEPPEKCPLCNAPADKFTEQSGEMAFADEHRIGVAEGADSEIIEGLRANFMGECTEVGMYLAMSRQADREGYPEIAEAYKRYAFEEAEHAAKFAELLGEVLHADTKKNLQLRFEAEHGATEGKLKLAKRAKELNLDAIHDTVHEMAKDEARHGKGFQGLLSRYFGG